MTDKNVAGNLKAISRRRLWVYILLTFFTAGIYPLMWLYKNQEDLFDEFGQELWKPYLPLISAFLIAWYIATPIYGNTENPIEAMIGIVVCLLDVGIWIYWSVQMTNAIRQYAVDVLGFNYSTNVFLAVVFRSYYVIYLINQLPAEFALHEKLTGNEEENTAS